MISLAFWRSMGVLVKSERKKLWSRANQRVILDETRGVVRRRTLGLKKAPDAMIVDLMSIDEMHSQLQWWLMLVLIVLTLLRLQASLSLISFTQRRSLKHKNPPESSILVYSLYSLLVLHQLMITHLKLHLCDPSTRETPSNPPILQEQSEISF